MRPLSGTKPPRSVEALSTEIESTPPRVIVGIPSSEIPSRAPETLESNAPPAMAKADAGVLVDVVIPKLLPVTIDEPARVSERPTVPPPASSLATIAEETAAPPAVASADMASPAAVSVVEPPAALHASGAEEEEEEAAPDTQRSLAPQVLTLDGDEREVEPGVASAEKREAAPVTERAAEIAARGDDPPSIDPDDVSVPPIGDVAVERFFSEGDVGARLDSDEDDALGSEKAKRKSDPRVVERRTRFARYVKWAVAGAAIVCLAAVGRTAVTSFGSSSRAASLASKQAVVALPVPAETVDAKPAVVTGAPQPVAARDEAPTTEPEAPAEAIAEESGDAKAEKEKARGLLERRKIADAIEAGEHAVKLDASDAEAWLILGAAYQEKGSMAQARRAYASCVAEAQTGPRQECAKMLR